MPWRWKVSARTARGLAKRREVCVGTFRQVGVTYAAIGYVSVVFRIIVVVVVAVVAVAVVVVAVFVNIVVVVAVGFAVVITSAIGTFTAVGMTTVFVPAVFWALIFAQWVR